MSAPPSPTLWHYMLSTGVLLALLAAAYNVVIGVIGISAVKPKDRRWPKKVWVLFAFGLALALAGAWQQAAQLRDADAAPDVTACLVDSKRPALVLVNPSDVVAEKIMYSYALFDLDSSNPNEPLRLLTNTAEFIRPHQAGGPENIFDSIVGPSPTKDGDRIAGSIVVSCPRCAVSRSYLVSITLGASGWFSPIEGRGSGMHEVVVSTDPTKPFFAAAALLPVLNGVPQEKRVRIVDQRTYYARGKTLADCPL